MVVTGIGAVLGFVLVTGVTAALTVPAIAITAQKSLPALLPANTAMYVTADLNPGQGTRDSLTAMGGVLSRQSWWERLIKPLEARVGAARVHGCLDATATKASGNLVDLGHDTAFALVPSASYFSFSSRSRHPTSIPKGLISSFVIVAPLDVHMTIYDALGGVSLSHPKHFRRYFGTTIYPEVIPRCDRVGRRIPSAYYVAVFKGYIVLGFGIKSVEEVIDTGSGRRPSLISDPQVAETLGALPSVTLGGFYVNGREFSAVEPMLQRLMPARLKSDDLLRHLNRTGILAGTVEINGSGLSFEFAHFLPVGRGFVPAASTSAAAGPFAALMNSAEPFRLLRHEKRSTRTWLQTAHLGAQARSMIFAFQHALAAQSAVLSEDASSQHSSGSLGQQLYLSRAPSFRQISHVLACLRSAGLPPTVGWFGSTSSGICLSNQGPSAWALILPASQSSPMPSVLWYTNVTSVRAKLSKVLPRQLLHAFGLPLQVVSPALASTDAISGSIQSSTDAQGTVLTVALALTREQQTMGSTY